MHAGYWPWIGTWSLEPRLPARLERSLPQLQIRNEQLSRGNRDRFIVDVAETAPCRLGRGIVMSATVNASGKQTSMVDGVQEDFISRSVAFVVCAIHTVLPVFVDIERVYNALRIPLQEWEFMNTVIIILVN